MLLVISDKPSLLEHHIALVPAIVVANDSHETQRRRRAKMSQHIGIGDVHIGIAIHDPEEIAEQMSGAAEGSAGAEELLAVEAIEQFHSARGAVAEVILEHFTAVAETQDDGADAVGFQKIKLMIDERSAGDFDQGLGDGFGDGAQTRSQTSGEECDGRGGDVSRRKGHELFTWKAGTLKIEN